MTREEVDRLKDLLPKFSNIIHTDNNVYNNWNYCKQYYNNFKFQLIEIDRTVDPVMSLPLSLLEFKWKDHLNYIEDRDFFKLQWLINDYLTTGFTFPVQSTWNFKLHHWEMHPGLLRELVYSAFNQTKWLAFYQNITDTSVVTIDTYHSVDDLLVKLNFKDQYNVYANLVNYYGFPLFALNVENCNIDECIKLHKDIFYNNLKRGINILAEDNTIDLVKQELDSWPEHMIKSKILFNSAHNAPSIKISIFNKTQFYLSLYFLGTNVRNYKQTEFRYINE